MPDPKPAPTPPADGGAAPPGPAGRVDPFRGYNFRILVDQVNEGHFVQFSGVGIKVHPVRYREGGENSIVHQLAGPVDYAEVVLKFGLTQSPELWNWFKKSLEGKPEPRHVSIIMLGPGGTGERLRLNLNDAWPCEFRGAPLDALGREVAVETLGLVYESVTRE